MFPLGSKAKKSPYYLLTKNIVKKILDENQEKSLPWEINGQNWELFQVLSWTWVIWPLIQFANACYRAAINNPEI